MKRLLIGLALIPVILLCVMLSILGTESGLRFALWQANIWAPDILTVESVDGKLTGPLDINGLSLSTSAQQLNIDTIAFRWTPSALFKRQLIIDKLAVDGIVVTVGGPSEPVVDEPADPFTLPERLALPASVFLQDIALTNIQIYTSADAESVLIDEVAIDLQYQRESDGLNTNILMQSELLSAELTLNAVARDEYPIDGQINWSANVPELARVDGNTSLSGTINELTIIQSVAKPYAIEANVVLRDTLTALSIDAQGQVGVESINAIKSDLPAVGIAGDFAFKGEPLDGMLQSTLRFDGELPGPINSTLLVNINQQLITLNSLTISVGDQPIELSASGSIDISGPEPLADLEIRWREFAWPWNDTAQMLSATGSAQLTGSPADATVSIDTTFNEIGAINGTVALNGQDIDATIDWSSLQWPLDGSVASNITGRLAVGERIDGYTLSLNTAVDTPQLSGILLSANGAGTQQSLYLPSLSLNAADGTLTGDLQLTWAPTLSFTTTLAGEKFNPSIFVPDFPGNLSIAVKAQGNTVGEVFEMELDTMMITGVLRDQPFDANVRASLNPTVLTGFILVIRVFRSSMGSV